MSITPRLYGVAAALLCAAAASAQVTWGTDTSVTQADISPFNGISGGPGGVFHGGDSFTSSAALLDGFELDIDGSGPWHRGLTRSQSQLSALIAAPTAPTFRAESILTGLYNTTVEDQYNGAVGFAQANAMDSFIYTGLLPTTITLTYVLDGSVLTLPGGFPGLSGISFSIGVLGNVTQYGTHIPTQTSENGAVLLSHNGINAFTTLSITDDTGTGTTQTLTASLLFDVNPGDQFWVAGRLFAGAVRDASYSDAYSTATGTFDQPQFILSLSAPTPGAGALALLVIPSAALRRRRR